jgi:hypothetical protein
MIRIGGRLALLDSRETAGRIVDEAVYNGLQTPRIGFAAQEIDFRRSDGDVLES